MTKLLKLGALLLALCSFGITSCAVYAHGVVPVPVVPVPAPAPAVVVVGPPVEYGYQPLLHEGYVVYYSHDGLPFYWVEGTRIWVPVHLRARYLSHWRTHRKAYTHWHVKRGHVYKTRRYHVKPRKAKKAHKGPVLKPKKAKKAHKGPILKPRKAKKPRLRPRI